MSDERLQARLAELRREYAVGEARLRELVQQESALREILLRISGAIQVLEELTTTPAPAAMADADTEADAGAVAGEEPDPRVLTVP